MRTLFIIALENCYRLRLAVPAPVVGSIYASLFMKYLLPYPSPLYLTSYIGFGTPLVSISPASTWSPTLTFTVLATGE